MSTASAGQVRHWLREAADGPASLPDEGYEALLGADGTPLEELCELADSLRQRAAGDTLTYVVNRNLDPPVVAGADPASRRRLAALVTEAADLGATEICMQGPVPADDDYLDLIGAVKAAAPELHLHAFRAPELMDGASRRGLPLEKFLDSAREAGLGSVPGTAARILDDQVRERMLGRPDLPVSQWTEVIETAHRAGLTSTSTMVFGHVETPAHQVAHLRLLCEIQDRTGGFTEFIAMPYLPKGAPPLFESPLGGLAQPPKPPAADQRQRTPSAAAGTFGTPKPPAGAAAAVTAPALVGADLPGPSWRQVRAVHAVSRLMLHGRIANIQAAWPKFGLDASVALLSGGANDLGGLLLDGRLAPDAGVEAGLVLSRDDVARVAAELGRPLRQRTTAYGEVLSGE